MVQYNIHKGDIMKLAIIGSRTLKQADVLELITQTLQGLHVSEIITGGANGVDSIAEHYARQNNIKCKIFYPVYAVHGKRAPLIRNNEIVKNCDALLAIWDGTSTGTAYTIGKAKREGKNVIVKTLGAYKNYHDNVWNFPKQGRTPKLIETKTREA